MDPVAHTLFGGTLAATGLRKVSRRATATLLIGANLPDIDAIVTVLGRDTSLLLRRGWTHGVLAMVVLPLLLTAAMALWDRSKDCDDETPFRLRWIMGLSFLSVWSHPALDWMNTYGVRLLMPFDGTWFYGDTLFIIDPWFWLTSAAGVVLTYSHSRRVIVRWSVLGGLATLLVLGFPLVPLWTKALWLCGIAVIVALRRTAVVRPAVVARSGLVTLVVYMGAMYGLARSAESAFTEPSVTEVQSNPAPGNPFEQRMVIQYDDRYRVVPLQGDPYEVQREAPDAVISAALQAPSVAGFTNWMRFPIWEKQAQPDGGWIVTFRDLRYVDAGKADRGIGLARVTLDAELKPVEH